MTVSQPLEPAEPQRGLTREERGRDVSQAQARAEAEGSTGRRLLRSMSLPFVLSQAENYPVGIKQFLQFCLLIIYPGWLFAVPAMLLVYYVGYAIIYPPLWLLFWPVRAWMKKNRPQEYAESQREDG